MWFAQRRSVALVLFALAVIPILASAQNARLVKPPKGAIVLFDGADTSKWCQRGSKDACQWDVVDGCLVVKGGTPDLMTKREFGDYRLHLEFWLPLMADQT